MRIGKMLLALAMLVSFSAAQACPDSASNQTKVPTVEKPLAPKPSV